MGARLGEARQSEASSTSLMGQLLGGYFGHMTLRQHFKRKELSSEAWKELFADKDIPVLLIE